MLAALFFLILGVSFIIIAIIMMKERGLGHGLPCFVAGLMGLFAAGAIGFAASRKT